MRWIAVTVCCLVAVGGARAGRDILRRQGASILRLGSQDGRLVLEEGDIQPEPSQYRRSKRIAQTKEYNNYLRERNQYDHMQNSVNVDTLGSDLLPSQSQTDFVELQGILGPQDPAMAQMYEQDSSLCLQKYLCEIAGTSPANLLMEEAALLAMVRSQEEITALLRSELSGPGGSRPRRSIASVEDAIAEAELVGRTCSLSFPTCAVSRVDILRVYKDQKDAFCALPMPYGL